MSEMKKAHRKKTTNIFLILILLFGLYGCGKNLVADEPGEESTESSVGEEVVVELSIEEKMIDRLVAEQASGLFISTYDISAFQEEWFAKYMGINTVVVDEPYDSLKQLIISLETVLDQYVGLQQIYFGFDIAKGMTTEEIKGLWEVLEEYGEVEISVLFNAPSLSYLQYKDEEYFANIEETLDVVTAFFEEKENVMLYYVGSSMWLVANDANYIDGLAFSEETAQKIMLYTFSDKEYRIGRVNYEACVEYSQELLLKYKEGEYSKGDLRDYTFVFVGDSIFARDRGPESIPKVVENFTGGKAYNCGRSGMSIELQEQGSGFLDAVYGLITGKMENGLEDAYFAPAVEEFYQDFATKRTDEKLVFVINLGINDYMKGNKLKECRHTLKAGIQLLQMRYLNAQYLLLTPNYISAMDSGTENMNNANLKLKDYAVMVEEFAEDMEYMCIDIYNDLGINKDSADYYLSDGVHLSENGRFLYGQMVANYLNETFGIEDIDDNEADTNINTGQ